MWRDLGHRPIPPSNHIHAEKTRCNKAKSRHINSKREKKKTRNLYTASKKNNNKADNEKS